MNALRNGGFERGTTDFWSTPEGGTLTVDNTNQLYGDYCGKFVSAGAYAQYVSHNDYIECKPREIVNVSGYVKSSSSASVGLILYVYDSDYAEIEKITLSTNSMDNTYQFFKSQYILPDDSSFIRVAYRLHVPALDDVFYFDSISLDISSIDSSISGTITLHDAESSETASGDTSSDKKDMMQFSSYYAQLNVISASGSSPTLDVDVCELNSDGYEVVLASFPQQTNTGLVTIDLPHTQGRQMYIKYTIGGTSPAFRFSVVVVGKISSVGTIFSGDIYENEHIMTDDNAYCFESSSLKLRGAMILISDHDALIGNSSNQRYPKTAGTSLSVDSIDISKLYFKNATAGQNTKINIIGSKV